MQNAIDTVTQLFVNSDNQNWDKVIQIFAETVFLDYSSMNGLPGTHMQAADIITAWKAMLPGFTFTHHQTGNVLGNKTGDIAQVSCYGTATHYLEHSKGNVWTVVGSYDFELNMEQDNWRITKMVFNFKYQDGNLELPQRAMELSKI